MRFYILSKGQQSGKMLVLLGVKSVLDGAEYHCSY